MFICVSLILYAFSLRINYDTKRVSQEPLFEISKVDAPVFDESILIEEDIEIPPEPEKKVSPLIDERTYVRAEAYLVGNVATGETYIEHNIEQVSPIASISKLFTAATSEHFFDASSTAKISQDILDTTGDAGHFILDEEYTAKELLYPLILESSNDAAVAYTHMYGDGFVEKMNMFAQEIGLSKTKFDEPSGLSYNNVSNARDLFVFAQYLYNAERELLDITRMPEFQMATTTGHGTHVFKNINILSSSPNFIGGKTGRTTAAKESMISLIRYTYNGKDYPLAIIVLRSDFSRREENTGKLFAQAMEIIQKKGR